MVYASLRRSTVPLFGSGGFGVCGHLGAPFVYGRPVFTDSVIRVPVPGFLTGMTHLGAIGFWFRPALPGKLAY